MPILLVAPLLQSMVEVMITAVVRSIHRMYIVQVGIVSYTKALTDRKSLLAMNANVMPTINTAVHCMQYAMFKISQE